MKKVALVAVLVLSGMVAPLFAEDAAAPDNALHGKVGVTYDTLYMWRGIRVFDSQTGIHPFVDLDLMGSGFHLEAIGHRANSSGFEESERWDYSPYYMGMFNGEDVWETRYIIGYRYFNYPDLSSHTRGSVDLQEMYAGFAFPRLLGVPGLVPGYAVIKAWPSNSETIVGGSNPNGGTYSGWAHVFMLDYSLPIEGLSSETPQQTLNFHVETVFNDGVDPRPAGGYTDSDWTHAMFGVSTDFDLGNNIIFTPAINYQITMEDDPVKGVSPDHDITWASATIKVKF